MSDIVERFTEHMPQGCLQYELMASGVDPEHILRTEEELREVLAVISASATRNDIKYRFLTSPSPSAGEAGAQDDPPAGESAKTACESERDTATPDTLDENQKAEELQGKLDEVDFAIIDMMDLDSANDAEPSQMIDISVISAFLAREKLEKETADLQSVEMFCADREDALTTKRAALREVIETLEKKTFELIDEQNAKCKTIQRPTPDDDALTAFKDMMKIRKRKLEELIQTLIDVHRNSAIEAKVYNKMRQDFVERIMRFVQQNREQVREEKLKNRKINTITLEEIIKVQSEKASGESQALARQLSKLKEVFDELKIQPIFKESGVTYTAECALAKSNGCANFDFRSYGHDTRSAIEASVKASQVLKKPNKGQP